MRLLLLTILLAANLFCIAQTPIEKTIPINAGQKLLLNLDDPQVNIQTWDKKEILIRGTVSINNGANDEAFELQVSSNAQEITITSVLKDKENIPEQVTIKKDDKEYFFRSSNVNDPEIKKFFDENGRDYSYLSIGIIKNIKLEVFVPKNTETKIQAKYGMVEVKNFAAPLTIESKYGGVDATIPATSAGLITARCRYGEILTNLGVKFDQANRMERSSDKWTEISAKLGQGPAYWFESKYGNVYLRKPE